MDPAKRLSLTELGLCFDLLLLTAGRCYSVVAVPPALPTPPSLPQPPAPPSLPSLPAGCADCVETLQLAQSPQAAQTALKRFRSAEGKVRLDMGSFSLITDPISQLRISLDHLKLEALVIPAVAVAMPGMALPGMNIAAPPIPFDSASVNIVQLGKSIVQGVEAEGFRYLFGVTDPLQPPAITSWEVWIHLATQLPVMTQAIGAFGQRTTICQCTAVEPPASLFQIPANYKVITPESPKLPTLPTAPMPSAPAMPAAPALPSMPAAPALPSIPSAPALPSASLPQAPSLPAAPAAPSLPRFSK